MGSGCGYTVNTEGVRSLTHTPHSHCAKYVVAPTIAVLTPFEGAVIGLKVAPSPTFTPPTAAVHQVILGVKLRGQSSQVAVKPPFLGAKLY